MNRDDSLAYIAVHGNNHVLWSHVRGEGWVQHILSPDVLEAMSDEDLKVWTRRVQPSHWGTMLAARKLFPDLSAAELKDAVDAYEQERPIGMCDSCYAEFEPQSDVYITWDAGQHRWNTFCSHHRPSRYWRKWIAQLESLDP